jgi:hypothetical protein
MWLDVQGNVFCWCDEIYVDANTGEYSLCFQEMHLVVALTLSENLFQKVQLGNNRVWPQSVLKI